MLFYKFKVKFEKIGSKGAHEDEKGQTREAAALYVKEKCESLSRLDDGLYVFPSRVCRTNAVIGVYAERKSILEKYREEIPAAFGETAKVLHFQEVVSGEFAHMLRFSEDEDEEEIFRRYGICTDFGSGVYECILPSGRSRSYFEKVADEYMVAPTFRPELERIYTPPKRRSAMGHPVHYMICSDKEKTQGRVRSILIDALYQNARVKSACYQIIDMNRIDDEISEPALDRLYNRAVDGTVAIEAGIENGEDDAETATANSMTVKRICKTALRYSDRVLTILCLPKSDNKIKSMLYEEFGGIRFVEITETDLDRRGAIAYLKGKAADAGVRAAKALLDLPTDGARFTAEELDTRFSAWYNRKLTKEIYPQYSEVKVAEAKLAAAPVRSKAYSELQSLIGLARAKETVKQAVDYFKMQKVMRARGLQTDHPTMTMLFTGNPGSAKTTVARLVSEIFREEGILSGGRIVECGRADLVGKYVGWTAKNVVEKFKKAQGGVLFIDEAYSLVDDRNGSFGDEAINTIVQEMENHREDVVVIFAGYPDKMQGFLDKNPGLRSRIAFHVAFDDYSPKELCEISELIAKNKGLTISPAALEKMNAIYSVLCQKTDFGNGRAARNLIEKSKIAMASRLVGCDVERLTREDLVTILPEDVQMPFRIEKTEAASDAFPVAGARRVIGFVA